MFAPAGSATLEFAGMIFTLELTIVCGRYFVMKEISHLRVRTALRHVGGILLFGAFLVTAATNTFGATYKVIRRFNAGQGGGKTPYAGLVLDSAGKPLWEYDLWRSVRCRLST